MVNRYKLIYKEQTDFTPFVLGTAYDSSADWFSFGCMLYKLLKGHSPFRQHKTKVHSSTVSSDSKGTVEFSTAHSDSTKQR